MENADVLIIGGGPAGASCAWQLKRYGLDVMVLDRASFPRDKVCAGWVTPAVLESLDVAVAQYADGRTLQPISGFRTSLIGDRDLETDYGEIVSYGIRRCEFDHFLLQRSGARLLLGEKIASLDYRGGQWVVNERIATPMLVGAGGHFCPVARHLGARPGSSERAVAAKEIEFLLEAEQAERCRVQPEVPELYFCRDLKGYGWCFRKDGYLNVGLGREDPQKLSEHLDAFCDLLIANGRIPEQVPRFKGHAYILYRHTNRKVLDDGVLLIGDAAGLAYPASGEGIRPAVESGLMAAEVIAKAAGDYRRASLAGYEKRLRSRFGGSGLSPERLLPRPLRNLLGKGLLTSPWATRHLILDRGFLHRQQPAFKAAAV